jgi:hypothetical protein
MLAQYGASCPIRENAQILAVLQGRLDTAITTVLSTCHMSILEEPAKVAAVIDDAAKNAFN